VSPTHLQPKPDDRISRSINDMRTIYNPYIPQPLFPEWFPTIRHLLDKSIEDQIYYECPPPIHSDDPKHRLFSDFIRECLQDLFRMTAHRYRFSKTLFRNGHRVLLGSYLKQAILERSSQLKSSQTSLDFLESLLIDDIKISETEWIDYEHEKQVFFEESCSTKNLKSTPTIAPSSSSHNEVASYAGIISV
jgi:hypothetical protein